MLRDLRGRCLILRKTLKDIRGYTIKVVREASERVWHKYPRQTKIQSFDEIQAAKVVLKNEKLSCGSCGNGFIGTSLKRDEYVCVMSRILMMSLYS